MWAFTFTKVVILQVLIIEVYGDADLRCPDNTQIDVTFFVDYPNYLGPDNLNLMLQLVADIIKQFKIGPNDARFAAFGFLQCSVTLYDLRNLTDYLAFEKALKGPGTQSAQPFSDQVFNTITGWNMFSNKETARKSAQSVAVGITNGISSYWNKTISLLKSLDVKIVILGIGKDVSVPILKTQSSSPEDALMTPSYDRLSEEKNKIIQRTCAGKTQQTTQQATQQTTTQKTSTTLPPVQQQSTTQQTTQQTTQPTTTKQTTQQTTTQKTSTTLSPVQPQSKTQQTTQQTTQPTTTKQTTQQATTQKPSTTLPPVQQQTLCSAYSSLTVQSYNTTTHLECFKLCTANRLCYGYDYKVGISCQLKLMTGVVTDINDEQTQNKQYITCSVKPDGCLVYTNFGLTMINFTNHKDCFNSCVAKPKCFAYTYSRSYKYCAHSSLDTTMIDPNIDKSTTAYLRCPKQ